MVWAGRRSRAACRVVGAVALMPPAFPRLPGLGSTWPGFSLGGARKLAEEEAQDQEPGNSVSTPVLLLTSGHPGRLRNLSGL